MDVILIECDVKGYHECGFTVTAGETFFLRRKSVAVARPSAVLLATLSVAQAKKTLLLFRLLYECNKLLLLLLRRYL